MVKLVGRTREEISERCGNLTLQEISERCGKLTFEEISEWCGKLSMSQMVSSLVVGAERMLAIRGALPFYGLLDEKLVSSLLKGCLAVHQSKF